jgi:hypothetical protein
MDIKTASHYLKLGYRIRRTEWEPEEHLTELAGMIDRVEVNYSYQLDEETKTFVKRRYVGSGSLYSASLEDLLADDWEIITTGIRKQFNKHGNFEYEDEPDWDNYVCTSSWFD